MNRLALFDCDGTLVDSQHVIVAAMERCFEGACLPAPPRDATRGVIGLSLTEAMAALLPDAEPALHVRLGQEYKAAFHGLRGEGAVSEPLYDGIAELVEALAAGGWVLGVATGKSDRGLGLCLDHHGLRHHFTTLQTADRHPSKPHPAMIEAAMTEAGATPETTVMIGDTSYDMAMARAAGAGAIGVAWGYHDADALRAAGAEAIAGDVAELAALLERRA